MDSAAFGVPLTMSRASLPDLGGVVGRGGEATIYELPGFRLPDVSGPLVYKEFHAGQVKTGLAAIVRARLKLDPVRQARLDAIAAWPCRIVGDENQATGLLMPRIPDSFFDRIVLLGSGGTKPSLRLAMNLFIPTGLANRIGRPEPTEEQRISICRDFASALSFFHEELRMVFGDINPQNAAYRIGDEPQVMFIDCDGARALGVVGADLQLNAPDWVPPEGGRLTLASDLYKLGLFVLRCLSPSRGGSILLDPDEVGSGLDTEGRAMLRRAITGAQADRPSARAWFVHLSRLLGDAIEPPKLLDVGLDADFVLSGRPTELHWTAEDATSIEVVTSRERLVFDGRPGAGSVALVFTEPGFVMVRAVNDLGIDNRVLGPLTVVTPPVQQPMPIAMPVLDMPLQGWPQPPELVLPRLPEMRPLAFPGRPGDVPAADDLPWPDLWPADFPFDLTSLTTGGPGFDLGFVPHPKRNR
ncbi:hypothetical protein OHS58_33515 [Amycolatopsis sp. NBC_00348]|uniref:hypothetical protein n=1 Tax=Amycolatopsis sp. NBC_00348 TaxID=2975956 RepID=UPI002E266128